MTWPVTESPTGHGSDQVSIGAVAVIGANGGIGRAIVNRLLERGEDVHVVSRSDINGFEHVDRDHHHRLDLRVPESVYEVLGQIRPTVLINAAGLGGGPPRLDERPPSFIDDLLQVNALGALHAARAVLPSMVSRGHGHIVTIGSTAAVVPVRSTPYGASKAAATAMMACLRAEFVRSGVRFTEVRPGRVDTDQYRRAGGEAFSARQLPEGTKVLEPIDVARAVEFALDAPSRVNVNVLELNPTAYVLGGPPL